MQLNIYAHDIFYINIIFNVSWYLKNQLFAFFQKWIFLTIRNTLK